MTKLVPQLIFEIDDARMLLALMEAMDVQTLTSEQVGFIDELREHVADLGVMQARAPETDDQEQPDESIETM